MADPVIRKFGVLSALWVISLGPYPCEYEGYPVRQAKIIRLQRRTFDTKKKKYAAPKLLQMYQQWRTHGGKCSSRGR